MEPLLFFYHMIVYRIQKEERVVSPNRRIGVLGGDRRQYYIAKLLQEGIFRNRFCGLQESPVQNALIL